MSIEPIQLELSNYNKLQILRKQLEDRSREFEEIEGTIRELLMFIKEVEYLKSISAAYKHLDASEQLGQLASLEGRRTSLHDLISNLEVLIPKLESEAKGHREGSSLAGPRAIQKNSLTDNQAVKTSPVSSSSSPSATTSTDPAAKKPMLFEEFRKKFPTSGV